MQAHRAAAVAIGAIFFATAGSASALDWTTHRDPAGFTAEMPRGWQVQAQNVGDIAIGDPQARAVALVRARLVRGEFNRWLAQDYPRTEPGMRAFRVEQAQGGGSPDVVHAWISYTNPQGVAKRARVVAVRRGDMATVFVAAAPTEEIKASLPLLARVLDSVRFEPPRSMPAGGRQIALPPLPSMRWVDPRENAFAVDLPAGWHTQGGLQRTTWNRRVAFESVSPDGRALIFSGDPTVPRMFILPNDITARYGKDMHHWGPDSLYVAPFQTAEQAGAYLVANRFRGQVTGTRPRPDLVELVRRNPLLQNRPAAATAADTEFRLADGRVGVVTVSTFGAVTPGVGGNWWAEGIHGFIAPPEYAAQVGLALGRMIGTFQVNPQWAVGERQHEIQLGKLYTDYLHYAQNLQQQTIAQRWASDAAIQAGRRDILGGTVRLQDPQTGEVFETQARDRYYFRVAQADRPTAIGTDVDATPLPQIDLRRLLQVGVDVADR